MSKTATIYNSANLSGDGAAENLGPVTFQLTSSPAQHFYLTINSGPNTISIPQYPSPAQVLDLIPPSNSAVNKWLMASGDTTGMQIGNQLMTRVALSTSITSFILRASGTEVVEIYFW